MTVGRLVFLVCVCHVFSSHLLACVAVGLFCSLCAQDAAMSAHFALQRQDDLRARSVKARIPMLKLRSESTPATAARASATARVAPGGKPLGCAAGRCCSRSLSPPPSLSLSAAVRLSWSRVSGTRVCWIGAGCPDLLCRFSCHSAFLPLCHSVCLSLSASLSVTLPFSLSLCLSLSLPLSQPLAALLLLHEPRVSRGATTLQC